MTIVSTEDNRNLEWRKSNVGSAMLQKMGWKEGQGIGRRSNTNTTALRALKRQAGLGLGAKIQSEGGSSDRSDHFASILQNLQVHHDSAVARKKVKKKTSKGKKGSEDKLILAQNRVTAGHSRKMREAKFSKKSTQDMACIFGSRDIAQDSSNVFGIGGAKDPLPAAERKARKKRKEDGSDNKKVSKKRIREVEGEKKKKKSKRKNEKSENCDEE